jgi:Cu-Zn family superoxide dismutase
MKAVPAAARITVTEYADGRSTVVGLSVRGLRPHRTYGTHVHTRPCGYRPDASGPHYQHRKDPHQPSVDPAYANKKNEVWLDFATDAKGAGASASRNEWRFRPGQARSVVIHERGTAMGHGEAGTAGERLACFTVPFDRTA